MERQNKAKANQTFQKDQESPDWLQMTRNTTASFLYNHIFIRFLPTKKSNSNFLVLEDEQELVSKHFHFLRDDTPFKHNCLVEEGDLLLVLQKPSRSEQSPDQNQSSSDENHLSEVFPETNPLNTNRFKLAISKKQFTSANDDHLVGIPIAYMWNDLGRFVFLEKSGENLATEKGIEVDSIDSMKKKFWLFFVGFLVMLNLSILLQAQVDWPVRVVRHEAMEEEFRSVLQPSLRQLDN